MDLFHNQLITILILLLFPLTSAQGSDHNNSVEVAASSEAKERPHKTIWSNGFYADAYGDIAVQNYEFLEESTSLLNLRGGWQLAHFPYLAFTVGLSASGLDGAYYRNEKVKEMKVTHYGPTAEALLFSDMPLYLSLSGYWGNGKFNYQKTSDDPEVKSQIRVYEYGIGAFYKFTSYFHLFAAAGQQSLTYSHRENFDDQHGSTFFLAMGLRGSRI